MISWFVIKLYTLRLNYGFTKCMLFLVFCRIKYCKTTFFRGGLFFADFAIFFRIRENQTHEKLPNSMIIVGKARTANIGTRGIL